MSENKPIIENGAAANDRPAPAPGSTFEHLRRHNWTVNQIMRAGGTAEDCAVALSTIIDAQAKRIVDLEMIAPRKIRLDDGRIMVWRCPTHLVPDLPVMSNTERRGASSRPSGAAG